jgi:hypothetical protein
MEYQALFDRSHVTKQREGHVNRTEDGCRQECSTADKPQELSGEQMLKRVHELADLLLTLRR